MSRAFAESLWPGQDPVGRRVLLGRDPGRRKEWTGRLVNPPVNRASTIIFDDADELATAQPGFGQDYYALQGTPSQWALAEALTELEPGAAGTMLYPTGLSAITAALLTAGCSRPRRRAGRRARLRAG